jgi:hypothetical protein
MTTFAQRLALTLALATTLVMPAAGQVVPGAKTGPIGSGGVYHGGANGTSQNGSTIGSGATTVQGSAGFGDAHSAPQPAGDGSAQTSPETASQAPDPAADSRAAARRAVDQVLNALPVVRKRMDAHS